MMGPFKIIMMFYFTFLLITLMRDVNICSLLSASYVAKFMEINRTFFIN